MKSTQVELVAELEKLIPTSGIMHMIAEAKAGEYHDYRGDKYDCGKVAAHSLLIQEAKHSGTVEQRDRLLELADAIREGEYDEQPDEADLEMMRKYMPRSLWAMMGL